MRSMSLKTILYEMGILIGIAVIGALLFNHLRPHGIVLWDGLNAAQKAPGPISSVPANTGQRHGAISRETAQALFSSGQAVFVDARTLENYQRGHIPGAVSLPLDRIDEMTNAFLAGHGNGTAIVTYCSGVFCEDAAHLADLLKDFGYTRISVFEGGMEAWLKEELPVE